MTHRKITITIEDLADNASQLKITIEPKPLSDDEPMTHSEIMLARIMLALQDNPEIEMQKHDIKGAN